MDLEVDKRVSQKQSGAGNITDLTEINPPITSEQGMINEDGENAISPLFTSIKNSMLHYETSFISPIVDADDPSPLANILDRQREENNEEQMFNMSTPYDQDVLSLGDYFTNYVF